MMLSTLNGFLHDEGSIAVYTEGTIQCFHFQELGCMQECSGTFQGKTVEALQRKLPEARTLFVGWFEGSRRVCQ